jgi:hypothetical protein
VLNYDVLEPGLPRFKYGLSFETMMDFHRARQWLSQTYGHAENTDHYDYHDVDPKTDWSWEIEYRRYMIYLKGDSELGWFKLKFGS